MELGAQLWTVREHTQTLADFAEALRKIADIGYKNIQVSGTCKHEPDWLETQLRTAGLRCVVTDYGNPVIPECEYIMTTNMMVLPETLYHNHAEEFAKNENGLNFLEQIPADTSFLLDTYWIQAAGGDPAWWIRRFAGRVPCVHLKDMSFDGKMAAIGDGNMNFSAIVQACRESGTRYMLVEQDDCFGECPFECLKRSYANLQLLCIDKKP
jgi:sugar phosphate isomerase/epimerase